MAVAVKHIDRNAIGHDQGWEDNNAAFTCPTCKIVFIVSGLIASSSAP